MSDRPEAHHSSFDGDRNLDRGVLYVLGTVVVMGVVPREKLVNSVAPFSDAARVMWGPWGAIAISVAVVLSSIGAFNGWTLLMGQVPMAAAGDRLFPELFGRLSARNVPRSGSSCRPF